VLPGIFVELDRFSKVSGLKFNTSKSCLIQTGWKDDWLRGLLRPTTWPDVRIAQRVEYLGVLIGKRVSPEEVFIPPLQKFRARLAEILPIIKSQSLPKKIRIVNAFLIPIFGYLARYLSIPQNILKTVQRDICQAIVPLGGRGFKYCMLVAPSRFGGPKFPLRDLWASNTAFLALRQQHLRLGFPRPRNGVKKLEKMRMRDHFLIAAFDLRGSEDVEEWTAQTTYLRAILMYQDEWHAALDQRIAYVFPEPNAHRAHLLTWRKYGAHSRTTSSPTSFA